ncbi:MAG: hypothetical protein WC761_00180 [Candidatus Paceibacterota bacterium]|jgi:hypothetical protein
MRNIIDSRGFIGEKDTTTTSLRINSGNVTIIGNFFISGSSTVTASIETQINPTYIPDPVANRNANTTALVLYNASEAISAWAPTAARTIDPSDAPSSMAFTVLKVNSASFGISISGSTGWTTPGGLETNYLLFGSDTAAAGSWLVRVDLPNKIVLCTPVS